MLQRHGLYSYQRRESLTRQKITTYRHLSGMNIDVLKRDGFGQKYAALAIPYGAMHTRFIDVLTDSEVQVPIGSLKLLSKMIFSFIEEGSLAVELAKYGISGNLIVDHSHLIFEIITNEYYYDAVEVLLDTVLNVDLNERKLAAAKRDVKADLLKASREPEYFINKNLKKAFYDQPEYYEEVEGNLATIESISLEDVHRVFRNIFNIKNLSLILAGEFDEEKLLPRIAEILQNRNYQINKNTQILLYKNYRADFERFQELNWQYTSDAFGLAYRKISDNDTYIVGGKEIIKARLEAKMLLDFVIGYGSTKFKHINETGLLGNEIRYNFNINQEFSYLSIRASSLEPRITADAIAHNLERFLEEEYIDFKDIEPRWKASVGKFIRDMDTVSKFGRAASYARAMGIEFADYATIYNSMHDEISEIYKHFEFIKPENRTVLICHKI